MYLPKVFLFTETVCVTSGGAAANKPCIFPFKFNGVVYFECTWDLAHLTEHKAWCSTFVDDSGHHVGGQNKWGNCGPGCPIPPDNRNSTAKPGESDGATTESSSGGKTKPVKGESKVFQPRELTRSLFFSHLVSILQAGTRLPFQITSF